MGSLTISLIFPFILQIGEKVVRGGWFISEVGSVNVSQC